MCVVLFSVREVLLTIKVTHPRHGGLTLSCMVVMYTQRSVRLQGSSGSGGHGDDLLPLVLVLLDALGSESRRNEQPPSEEARRGGE